MCKPLHEWSNLQFILEVANNGNGTKKCPNLKWKLEGHGEAKEEGEQNAIMHSSPFMLLLLSIISIVHGCVVCAK